MLTAIPNSKLYLALSEVSVTDDDFPRPDVNPYWQFKPTKNEPFILDLDDGDT